MIRIAGINIDDKKHIDIALTAIYGIGRSKAQKICTSCNIQHDKRFKDLSLEQVDLIREHIKTIIVEGDLRRTIAMNIKRLIDINSYRGKRHKNNLPVHGQRTISNAKTAKKRNKAILSSKR